MSLPISADPPITPLLPETSIRHSCAGRILRFGFQNVSSKACNNAFCSRVFVDICGTGSQLQVASVGNSREVKIGELVAVVRSFDSQRVGEGRRQEKDEGLWHCFLLYAKVIVKLLPTVVMC